MAHDTNSAQFKAAKAAHEEADRILKIFGHDSEVVFNCLCEQPYQINLYSGDEERAKAIQDYIERTLKYPVNVVFFSFT